MKVVIIQYSAGNTQSVLFALQRLGVQATVTNNADEIKSADKVILPGVGAAKPAMEYLHNLHMVQLISNLKQPVLGICLGMQLLCNYTPEGDTACLNVFKNIDLKKFEADIMHKVPQVGWNKITHNYSNLFKTMPITNYVYNVHSYYVPICEYTTATCNYTLNYSAALQYNNYYGVQFHPEKSSDVGNQILQNFLNL